MLWLTERRTPPVSACSANFLEVFSWKKPRVDPWKMPENYVEVRWRLWEWSRQEWVRNRKAKFGTNSVVARPVQVLSVINRLNMAAVTVRTTYAARVLARAPWIFKKGFSWRKPLVDPCRMPENNVEVRGNGPGRNRLVTGGQKLVPIRWRPGQCKCLVYKGI